MCRDALLHRSHEIQPAFFDQELKFIKLDFIFIFFAHLGTSLGFTNCAAVDLHKSESVRHKQFPTCYKKLINSTYLSGFVTVVNHTFSAFWLRSSVVSVLISLISGTWRMASHEFK